MPSAPVPAKTVVYGAKEAQLWMDRTTREVDAIMLVVLKEQAQIIEDRMKREHPWQNRTFQAERNLACGVWKLHEDIVLEAANPVEYGIYLETMQRGRFAVVTPTLRSQYPVIEQKLNEAFNEFSSSQA